MSVATLTHTYTSTYNASTPACPYLRCDVCEARVEFWLEKRGPLVNEPCGHSGGYHDVCPSWGPVDGCQCKKFLGHVPHPSAPAPRTKHGEEQGPL
jgi:hypothetical protein